MPAALTEITQEGLQNSFKCSREGREVRGLPSPVVEPQVTVEMPPNRIERVNKARNSQAHPYLMLKSKGQQNISPGVAN